MGERILVDYLNDVFEDLASDIYSISRDLYENPETGYQEMQACKRLCAYLQEHDFEVENPVGGIDTAFKASFPSNEGNTVAFVLEYDAVPDVGHGCGHNLIAAGLAAAGVAAKQLISELNLNGRIQLIGTPAEEGGRGKFKMLEAGVFDDVDACLQFHPDRLWGYDEGQLNAQSAFVEFAGSPAHSTSGPWDGINALDAVIQTFNAVNALREHLSPDLRVSGVITDGGGDIALVPAHAAAHFRIRGYDKAEVRQVVEKVKNCAEAGALATGAELKWDTSVFEPSPVANPMLKDLAIECAEKFDMDISQPRWISETTDYGIVSEAVPSLLVRAKCWPQDTVSHTEDAADKTLEPMAQKATGQMARALAMAAVHMLEETGLIAQGWKQHNARKDD